MNPLDKPLKVCYNNLRLRRDGWVVEGTRLESVRTLPGTGGSNPPLSAKWDCVEPQGVWHGFYFMGFSWDTAFIQ